MKRRLFFPFLASMPFLTFLSPSRATKAAAVVRINNPDGHLIELIETMDRDLRSYEIALNRALDRAIAEAMRKPSTMASRNEIPCILQKGESFFPRKR